MIQLRDYQTTAVGQIRTAFASGLRRVLYVLPTGGGKTTVFAYVGAGVASRGKRVTIVAHRDELLRQISDRLTQFSVPHAVLTGGSLGTPRHNVVVASVFTLARRLDHFPPPDLIVIDESHHVTKATTWGRVAAHFPNALTLGVTATPVRLSGEGLGEVFETMILGPSVSELTARGYLTPAAIYGPPERIDFSGLRTRAGDYEIGALSTLMDKPRITGNAVQHYRRLADGKAAVAFCCSIAHAHDVAEEFRQAGYRAVAVDGKQEKLDRRQAVEDLASGRIQVMTSCDIVSEGFDCPRIEVGIMLRPTQSTGLWLQQVGRCLRPSPGKTEALILDHAGNSMVHGLPDTPRDWTLEGSGRTGSRSVAPSLRTCPKCLAIHPPAPECPRCGHRYQAAARQPEVVEGELVRMDGAPWAHGAPPDPVPLKVRVQRATTIEALEKIRVEMNYRPGWVAHVLEAKARAAMKWRKAA